MELHELHVLQRQAGTQNHGVAVARAGVRRGAGEVGAAIAAGGEDGLVGAEPMECAVFKRHGDDAAAGAFRIHHQIEREILDEELSGVAERLAVKSMQHGVAGAVGGGAGALGGRTFAELGGHAAERALVDPAILGARERKAVMFQFVDGGGGMPAQVFDRVLVAEPVGPLDGVVHVPAPVVGAHVAERGGHPALSGHGMRASRKHLRHAGGFQAGFGAAERRAKSGATRTHDNDVVGVVDHRVGLAIRCSHSRASL